MSLLYSVLFCCLLSLVCHGLKLYSSQVSRGPLVNWYLHEIGKDFELVNPKEVMVENPNPFGQVPCLDDDGCQVFES